MRFQTKFDRWILAALALGFAGTLWPLVLRLTTNRSGLPLWAGALLLAPWVIVVLCMLPQYYELRAAGLFIRQGWRRILIPYSDLASALPYTGAKSSAVFSTSRILIMTSAGRQYEIAPADQPGFLDELARRAPLLERRESGLSLPFAPLSNI